MACEVVELPGGRRAIVCGPRQPRRKCQCGNPATLECDWKVPARRSGTCDKPLCPTCTHVPAPGKDLCPAHAAMWKARRG
ncbi:hypothetical protein [Novosphingobium sp. EMRT-2]|uniref:hypothetical protein n=1 Tax=Novosphingobium sp. EMRT-2 TaxID=2571749 RepID=UPI0010BDAC93|nr:hypothetical protein [Novosphingobium sp. EMRT-2]QCI92284.1 hypothetical protein FA702_01015 [Novosphingobium sp. EMRT-2]